MLRIPSRLASAFPMCKALSYLLPMTVDKRVLEVSFLHCLVSPRTENSPFIWVLSDLMVLLSHRIMHVIQALWCPMHKQLTEEEAM